MNVLRKELYPSHVENVVTSQVTVCSSFEAG